MKITRLPEQYSRCFQNAWFAKKCLFGPYENKESSGLGTPGAALTIDTLFGHFVQTVTQYTEYRPIFWSSAHFLRRTIENNSNYPSATMSNRQGEDQIMMRDRAGSQETRHPAGNAQPLLSNLVKEILKMRSEAIQKQAVLSTLLLQEVQRAIVEQTVSQSLRASQQPVLSTSPLDANGSNANIKNLVVREEASTAKHPLPRPTEKFPKTLYRMLIDASLQNNDHIVCFAPSGKVFFIRDPQAFESEILPHYFYHGKLPSFRRQLNLYGFRLLSHGAEAGGYAHAVFDRNQRHVSESIRRVPTTSNNNTRRK